MSAGGLRAGEGGVVVGAIVLITGAGRGMGELYARRAARAGAAHVVLWDIDDTAATRVAQELRREVPGVRTHVDRVDISEQTHIAVAAQRVRDEVGTPDIVINNAGIVRGALFWEHDAVRDIEATMRINALAPMWLTREFLPDMISDATRAKRILNIASAAGTLANPRMSVYAASKWAMVGWSDSVRLELQKSGHHHVAVTTFCPSYVSTGMFEGARGPLLTPILTPHRATSLAWRGMVAGRPLVTAPWSVRLSMVLRGILPVRVWDTIADRVFGVYSSMDRFTGRGV